MTRSEERIPRLRSRGRANRRRLLDAARRLLAQSGGTAPRFCDVFTSAGVSRGSAYRIYDDIDDLMNDLAADCVEQFVEHLVGVRPTTPPGTWMELTDFIIQSGAEYWARTENTLRVMPRLRATSPASYKASVHALADALEQLYARYFELPDIPAWHSKLVFATRLCDIAYTEAVRADGSITPDRLQEAQVLCKTYLGFSLPATVRPRRRTETSAFA